MKAPEILTEPPAVKGNTLFPVFFKLEQLQVLIVGGGSIGLEKITAVLGNSPSTKVTLVARKILPEIRLYAKRFDSVKLIEREFEVSDLDDKDLVIAATGDRSVSLLIREESTKRKLLINVADTPDLCDFYLGSIVKKGDLKIAISTNGKSPTLAKRLKEVFNEAIPDETQQSIENLNKFRDQLKGDFANKVKQLNEVTSVLVEKQSRKKKLSLIQRVIIYSASVLAIMVAGHLLFTYLPLTAIGGFASEIAYSIDSSILWFILGGFIAQMIDGALGMAYGVSATTFLMSFGVPPAAASASVHASEIFTSGVSGLMHLKFGNVNNKLFRNLLIPGVIGAILGAYVLSSLEEYNYIIKPLVASYTLFLGFVIISKALKKDKIRKKIKRLVPLATVGGFLDSLGGGGWGPIVSSTLIARGRNARYTIGSVNLAEFFVALASSITFTTLIGMNHWQIIAGLIIGGCIAAPIAAYFSSKLPTKTIMIMVGVIVIIVSLRIIYTVVF
ncbi:MAG: TSUP family transporter [Bacteroidota bacterium]|nr:TSUP family transporter [Bacteroidota bacterium]